MSNIDSKRSKLYNIWGLYIPKNSEENFNKLKKTFVWGYLRKIVKK